MKEWYLLTSDTRPNSIGGYENDAFVDYKEDAFQEALQTDVATTVTLYNSDLSEAKDIRCIVQGNTADTQLKSMERSILCTIGILKAGMYVYFENRYWLVTGYPGNNSIYEKATIILCQYKLRWQNNSGQIIERWANIVSASKYDTGTSGNQTIILASNNFTILIPDDDMSATLEDKRVFIDRDIKNLHKVFEITRSDDVLYLYGEHGGVLSFIADRDEFNPQKDRPDLGLCDYKDVTQSENPDTDETGNSYLLIDGDDKLRFGLTNEYTLYSVTENNNDSDSENDKVYSDPSIEFQWNVISDLDIQQQVSESKIQLSFDNMDYIGSSILLQVLVDDEVQCKKEILLAGLF